jgi:hypothetical protein
VRDEVVLARVRSYKRMENGRPETVREYSTMRKPGEPHPVKDAESAAGVKGWIPEPKWLEGQAEWVTKGEAAWKADEAARDARHTAQDSISQGGGAGSSAHTYEMPDPERLSAKPTKNSPAHPRDHKFFQENPVSPGNVIASYDRSTEEERRQGMRWYTDGQYIASAIANGDTEKGAGVLAAYSPQTGWPANMQNAARALAENRALGPGDGMITGTMQRSAQRLLDGEPQDAVLVSPKTKAFGRLLAHGADAPDDKFGNVVVDRHAMSVAMGKRLTRAMGDKAPIGRDRYYQHVADQYRAAALAISKRDGTQVSPHQLQAITWLRQQAENTAEDENERGGAGKGRTALMRNQWQKWEQYAREHGIDTELGTTAAAPVPITEAEARGNSRGVSSAEFHTIAADGRHLLNNFEAQRTPATALIDNLANIKESAYQAVQQPWGGMTIDTHTGQAIDPHADKFALSVKPPGATSMSVPDSASEADFSKAVDAAVKRFAALLEQGNYHLGIFHDDAHGRIDIDPVVVVDTQEQAEAIGAYTHNIGGAYRFSDGNGYFPPHITGSS